MKKIFSAFTLLLLFIFSSCDKSGFLEPEEKSKKALEIVTRAAEGEELLYPIEIFAFDASGVCRARQTQNSASQSFSLNLPLGTYKIIAVAGTQSVQLPQNATLNSVFTLHEDADEPIQMGKADVVMTGGNSKAYIQMQYLVASVNVTLSDLPVEVYDAGISISNPYTQWSFNGTGSEPTVCSFSLEEGDFGALWESGTFYVLPTEGPATLTISLTSSEGTTSYAYTCPEPLKAGVPYELSGSYTDGELVVSGEFAVKGWGEKVSWNFNFGPGYENQPLTPIPQGGTPVAGQMWNNHIVAHVESSSDAWYVLLLSKGEEEDMPSARSIDDPNRVFDYVASYEEDGLTDWKIPTRDQAKILQSQIGGSNLSTFNAMLSKNGLPLIYDFEPGKSNTQARYLCNDGYSAFSYANTSAPAQAGEKKTYRIRLVKEITVNK